MFSKLKFVDITWNYKVSKLQILKLLFVKQLIWKWLSGVNLLFNIFYFLICFTWCFLRVLIVILSEKELTLTLKWKVGFFLKIVCWIAISCSSIKEKCQWSRKKNKLYLTFHSFFYSCNFCNVSSFLVSFWFFS